MDLNKKKDSPETNEFEVKSLSKDEMEEVAGGNSNDDIRAAALRWLCKSGRHTYETREEKRLNPGGGYFTRKISVCKVCGHTEITGWSPLER